MLGRHFALSATSPHAGIRIVMPWQGASSISPCHAYADRPPAFRAFRCNRGRILSSFNKKNVCSPHMSHPQFDVVIVGAGPAGSTAALHLQNSGLRVCLMDKATFPRDKICGDALSGTVGYELHKLGPQVMQAFMQAEPKIATSGIRFVSPNLHTLDIILRKVRPGLSAPGYLFPRIHFDQFLFNLASNHPHIQTISQCTVQSINTSKQHVTLQTSQGHFSSRFIIAADGAQSIIARHCGIQHQHPHLSAGVRQYFTGVTGLPSPTLIELHFLPETLPGYVWIFPLPNGLANVGMGMRSDVVIQKKISLRHLFQHIIHHHPHLSPRFKYASALEPPRGFPLPLGSLRRPLVHGPILLTGDAAACIDPFTGEGIGYAMTSGRIAAQSIIHALHSPNPMLHLHAYNHLLHQAIGSEMKTSYRLQQLLQYPRLFDRVVQKANQSPAFKDLLRQMIEEPANKSQWLNPLLYLRILWPF